MRIHKLLMVAATALATACAPMEDPGEPRIDPFTLQELPQELGTQDMHRLLEDSEIYGGAAISEAEVQAFLNKKNSGLRNYRDPGYGNRLAADIIANVSKSKGVSPLYMLARIQTESGLVNKTVADSTSLTKATGCGCPDGGSCNGAYAGFGKQVECGAGLIRTYLDEINRNGASRTGWRVGVAKNTLDPCTVTPQNKATAVLYTYTPWVGAYARQCGTSQWGGSSLVALNLHNFAGQHTWGQDEDPALLKPATVSKQPGQLNTFIRGADDAIWDRWWTGSEWTAWQSLGGNNKYGPAAVSVAPGTVDVYSVGTDNALWHKHWNGTVWSNWETRGGTFTSGPAAVSLSPGTVHLYARGSDNAIWQKFWNGTQWSNWESLGGILTSGPAAVSLSPGTVQVYARGTDNAIYQKSYNGTQWSNWESLGGNLTSGPGAVSMSAGTVHVYARGGDNAIWQKFWNGTVWSNWETLGGTFTSGPSAGSLSPGTLHVQARGADNSVWQKSWSGTEWSAWQNLGGSMK